MMTARGAPTALPVWWLGLDRSVLRRACGSATAMHKRERRIADRLGVPESSGGCWLSGSDSGPLAGLFCARRLRDQLPVSLASVRMDLAWLGSSARA